MGKLNIGMEIRDFDLERMGFSLSVLDEGKKRQSSEAYLRMTLAELNTFVKALKTARDEIEVSTLESVPARSMPAAALKAPLERNAPGPGEDDRGFLSKAIGEKIAADITFKPRLGSALARAKRLEA